MVPPGRHPRAAGVAYPRLRLPGGPKAQVEAPEGQAAWHQRVAVAGESARPSAGVVSQARDPATPLASAALALAWREPAASDAVAEPQQEAVVAVWVASAAPQQAAAGAWDAAAELRQVAVAVWVAAVVPQQAEEEA